jgi:MOSC domain-containing protein YiiM
MVRFLNLDGDAQADRRVHGGPDQAVYCYPHEHVTAWREELGRDDLVPGRLGENLTIEGYLEDDVRQGDVFRAGRALLEATKPRMPCFKLAAHIGSGAFGKRFVELRRTGWYCRVLEEGPVAAGDAFVRVRRGEGRTIAEMVGSREAGIGTGEGR